MNGEPYFRHAPATVSRLVAGEVVIIRVPDGEMAVLNETGGAVWCAADGTRRPGEIAALLAGRYGLESPPDVRPLLEELVRCDLMVSSDEPLRSPAAVPPFPDAVRYESPSLRSRERLETLAAVCDSAWGDFGECQLEYVCNTWY